MTLSGRKELEQALGETYREAGLAEKQKILDSFVKATGYGRKYAMKLLNRTEERPVSKKKGRHSVYGNDVVEALATIWEKADFICSKRLVPFLPVMVEALERHGHLQLEASTKESLLKLSTATMDRLLKPQRTQMGKRRHYIKSQPGLLRELVTVRTFADWSGIKEPGYFEMDLVSHNGNSPAGGFCHTLVLTDVITQWTEFTALPNKEEQTVIAGLETIAKRLPIAVKGLDVDNGSEFLNHKMETWCRERNVEFTRGRSGRKNDQCYVEERNGSIIRKHVGYKRFGLEMQMYLLELYSPLRLFVNHYQPSQKLESKERRGARVTRRHSKSQTPLSRLLDSPTLSDAEKERLQRHFNGLDPVALQDKIQYAKKRLKERTDSPSSKALVDSKPCQTKKGRPRGSRNKDRDILLKRVAEIMCNDPSIGPKRLGEALVGCKPMHRRTLARLIDQWREAYPELNGEVTQS